MNKHRAELFAALESTQLALKPSYIWDLTSENCHQIYSRLCKLKIDLFPAAGIHGTAASLSVIELHPWHNECNNDNNNDGITFFGSIPLLIANINSILLQLDRVFDSGAPNRETNHHHKNEVFQDSFFIDVSATIPAPRIITVMQDKEVLAAQKFILLHIRDYLHANIDASCLNANDCLRTLANDHHHNVPRQQQWDLCFLSGVMLGYPVIYCNSTPDQGNCLSHQPLCNYVVQLDHHSTPMYSFSVPQAFEACYQHRINQWFKSLSENTTQPERLSLRQSVETYPLILT